MKNQCDGCVIGLPVVMGIHRTIENEPYMCCTRHKYAISKVELAVLKRIYDTEWTDEVNTIRLRLQARGFCRLSSQDGLASFKSRFERGDELFWSLTEQGENVIDEGLC